MVLSEWKIEKGESLGECLRAGEFNRLSRIGLARNMGKLVEHQHASAGAFLYELRSKVLARS